MWNLSDELLVDKIIKTKPYFKLSKQKLKQQECILKFQTRYEFNVEFIDQLHGGVYKSIDEIDLMANSGEQLNEMQENLFTLNEQFAAMNEKNASKKDLILSKIYKLNEDNETCLKLLELMLPRQVDNLRRAAKVHSKQMKQEIWSLLIHMKQNLSIENVEKSEAATTTLSLLNTLTTMEQLYSNLLHNLKQVLSINFDFINDFGGLKELPFLAIDVAFYGIQSFIVAAFNICRLCDRLAEQYFQHGCLEKCNDFIIENFHTFKAHLIEVGSCGNFDERLQNDDADFYLIERQGKLIHRALSIKAVGENTKLFNLLHMRLDALRRIDEFLQQVSLPILPEQPQIVVTTANFKASEVMTPFGKWRYGARVAYALQYESDEGKVSKIGAWSESYTINDKACPVLELPPAEKGYTRLIYRKFEAATTQLVGRLQDPNESSFHDINSDLFELAGSFETENLKTQFQQLLKSGADFNTRLDYGSTPLHNAAAVGNTYALPHMLLSENFIDLNAKNLNSYTPLHLAVVEGHLDFVVLLLKMNVDVNAQIKRSGLTALHLATARGHLDILTALLKQHQIDINKKDAGGFTALHYAALKEPKILKALLSSNNTQVNATSNAGLTPLHIAVITQHLGIIEILHKSKQIDINRRCHAKFAALHFAIFAKNTEVLTLLLKHTEIDMNMGATTHDLTALHYAVLLRADELLKQLLSFEHVDVKAKAAGDLTALHMAVLLNEKKILVLLLQGGGADIDARTQQAGFTALHLAAKFGRETLLRILTECGADLSLKTFDGSTALNLATYNETSHLTCFRWLIEKGAVIS